MPFDGINSQRWKSIRDLAGRLLDESEGAWDDILAEQCGADEELRQSVLHLARNYSESGDLFGAEPVLGRRAGPQPPERIGPYRIAREIGSGGMGSVYLAYRDDQSYYKQVAIKLIPRLGGRSRQRLFQRERQILALLEHPHITRLLDGGEAGDGSQYLVMEYVDGIPLTEYTAGRPAREILTVFLDVCAAIQYAHQNMVVHRDLKPSNILVTREGQVKVLDFGIARLLEQGPSLDAGQGGITQAVMTPAYASPEQLAGQPANTLSDIYSLGVVLHRLLTGQLPQGARPAPSRWRPTLRGDLDSIVLKMLEVNPAHRYTSVEQLARDIERHLRRQPVEARQGAAWYRAWRFVQRRCWAVAAAVMLLAVLGAGVAATLSQKRLAERRFEQIKGYARSTMFEYQERLSDMPGSTALRAKMASDAVQYLDQIAAGADGDDGVRRETALAYRRVGEVQGYGRVANLGDQSNAVVNLGKSAAILEDLLARNPRDPGLRVELSVSLERIANALSLSGRNGQARVQAERAIALLSGMDPGGAAQAESAAWRALSEIEERCGRDHRSIEAAHRAVERVGQAPGRQGKGWREARALALGRLARAITWGRGPDAEALESAQQAVALYPGGLPACGRDRACRLGYLLAREQVGMVHNFAGRAQEAIPLYRRLELETAALIRGDPHDRQLLRILKSAQMAQGTCYQSLERTEASLKKLRDSIRTAERIVETDSAHPEAACSAVQSHAKYAEVLVQGTGRIAEAREHLRTALRLSDASSSDSLTCLDYRKVTVINLARVAERSGDWAAGMEWRRETVRTAARYVALTPGEPLGLVIEAGANFELGLGGLNAAQHGDALARLREARQALEHARSIYQKLQALGWPLKNQYRGWPERTAALLSAVEGHLRSLGLS
ncbi:serine/threonine-protein kinase [Paludibaculum fermentans]|uniref:Serine/threonine protein kinase n=1 Tax=Paludibaculum fermentans TaxID=1473598 RepID=A0A7S7NPY1_PALFE|nr:serine/threonine-protein kinase [Paludibaculum fermentans]QOY87134.1 serine/threonine protein kinase [Paludibaculum fermentans]